MKMAKEELTEMNDELYEDFDEDFDDEDFDANIDDEDDWDFEALPSGVLLNTESKEYHTRIKLNDSPVKIWRELVVPSNISLELLAKVLIDAMEWEI